MKKFYSVLWPKYTKSKSSCLTQRHWWWYDAGGAVGTSVVWLVSSPSPIVWVWVCVHWCVCAPGDARQPGAKGRPHTPGEDSSFQQGESRNCIIIAFIPNDGLCALKRHAISVIRMFKMKTCFSRWLQGVLSWFFFVFESLGQQVDEDIGRCFSALLTVTKRLSDCPAERQRLLQVCHSHTMPVFP